MLPPSALPALAPAARAAARPAGTRMASRTLPRAVALSAGIRRCSGSGSRSSSSSSSGGGEPAWTVPLVAGAADGSLALRGGAGEASRLEKAWRLNHRAQEGALGASALAALQAELRGVEARAQPTEAERAGRDALVQRLEAAASSAFDGCSAVLFGSALSGLWTPRSDLDGLA
ncbi:unnamed protein product, partial [Prorocentrum cordatum]